MATNAQFEQLLAKAKPMTFSGPMSLAIRAGRKTETRRLMNPQPEIETRDIGGGCTETIWRDKRGLLSVGGGGDTLAWAAARRARFAPGDLVYVAEAWQTCAVYDPYAPRQIDSGHAIRYVADGERRLNGPEAWGRVRSPRFMLKADARTILSIGGVEGVRLQDITEEQARAEGFADRDEFMAYYDTLHKPGERAADNGWVWRYHGLTLEAMR